MPLIYDELGNVVGETMSLPEINKVADAAKARSDFSNTDPRRLDKGDYGAEAIRLTQLNMASKVEAKTSELENTKKIVSNQDTQPDSIRPQVINAVTENILHNYANYTYSISLHVIPITKYNKIITGEMQYHTADKTVLIASGGRRNTDFSRNQHFSEDFYFEDLKMTTVVGLNSRTRNTNAIDITFTIIEPYGFTFVNKLLKVADELKAKSWFQLPFMLQIEFFGNSDEGEQLNPIPNTTKRIPVKLISCKSKVTSKGGEYQVQAIPYNHSAFSESVASTPATLKVQAKTLEEFFSATGSAGEAASITKFQQAGKERQEQISKEIKAEQDADAKSTRVAELEKQKQNLSQDMANTGFIVYSYAAAINDYQTQLKNNNYITFPEEYRFVFENQAMAKSSIVVPKKTEIKSTPMISVNAPGGIAAIRAQAGLPVAGPDANTEIFTINAGTSIIEVINQAMRASDYIRDQFTDPSSGSVGQIIDSGISDGQLIANKLNKPIKWYKIIPVIEIKDFDNNLNRYSRKITYYINTYTYHNSKFRDAPKSMPAYYSKKYNYMYTGQNHDVLDFNIDFDMMFFSAITADKFKSQAVAVQKQTEEKSDAGVTEISNAKVQLPVIHPVTGQANMPNPASVDNKSILINDFAASTMSSSRGDMINVKLKIIGDPQLIKQDDVMYNSKNSVPQAAGMIDPVSNSLVFDAGEVFSLLEFKTPLDFDDENGLMKFETVETSVFSGLYKIITVENEFRQGIFTQNLEMIRLFDQPAYDTITGSKIQNNQRTNAPTTPKEQQDAVTEERSKNLNTNTSSVELYDRAFQKSLMGGVLSAEERAVLREHGLGTDRLEGLRPTD